MESEAREVILELTREVSRLSTLVERNLEDNQDKEARMRKVEKWMYGIPAAYLLTLGTLATTLARTTGK